MYQRIRDEDFRISKSLDQTNSSFIYGEVDALSIYEIVKKYYKKDNFFIDVGSGCGKIVVFISKYLDIFCDGVEIDSNRFLKSNDLLDSSNLHHKIEFINDSFTNIYFGNYDILYCCNLVFSQEDNMVLYNKIENEFKGLFILFDFNEILDSYLIEDRIVKTNWNKKQNIFIFYKN
jgi:hypothetical protein